MFRYKSLGEKCKTLKDSEIGHSNEDVAAKYENPNTRFQRRLKKNVKCFAASEQFSNKRK